ncbi:unnamed protein product [Cylicocyclus nassatus]|uniref:Uncharacterized protein n=1 Tax=Cylicocyclus nassatus TaxID=53992 RepID=A0AA36MHL1_CYLNA|nr:unnamed protein product [Cylicocyclus nassatus]
MFAVISLSILPGFLLACAPTLPERQVIVLAQMDQLPVQFVYGNSSEIPGVAESKEDVIHFIASGMKKAVIEAMDEDDWKVSLMSYDIFDQNITVSLSCEPLQCNANITFDDECPKDTDSKCCAVTNDLVEATGDPNEKTSTPVSSYKSIKLILTTNDYFAAYFDIEKRSHLTTVERKLRKYDNAFASVHLK